MLLFQIMEKSLNLGTFHSSSNKRPCISGVHCRRNHALCGKSRTGREFHDTATPEIGVDQYVNFIECVCISVSVCVIGDRF